MEWLDQVKWLKWVKWVAQREQVVGLVAGQVGRNGGERFGSVFQIGLMGEKGKIRSNSNSSRNGIRETSNRGTLTGPAFDLLGLGGDRGRRGSRGQQCG